jgi:hypothetical protein
MGGDEYDNIGQWTDVDVQVRIKDFTLNKIINYKNIKP